MTFKFTVVGDPQGHIAVTQRSKWRDPRAKKIAAYKETVRRSALCAMIMIPVKATEGQPIIIHTTAYFRNHRHPDPESVRRAIKDALWPHKWGGDKYVGGSEATPLYDSKNPRVEVEISW